MDDEFLYALRKKPPRNFAARLKARLDRPGPAWRFPAGSRFFRGMVAAVVVGGAAFAALTVSMPGVWPGTRDVTGAGEGTAAVQEAQEPARRRGSDGLPGTDPLAPSKAPSGGSSGAAKPSPAATPPAPDSAEDSGTDGPDAGPLSGVPASRLQTNVGRGIEVVALPDASPYLRDVAQRRARDLDANIQTLSPAEASNAFCTAGFGQPGLLARFGRMTADELRPCTENRVGDVVEVKIGHDAVVFARSNAYGAFAVSPSEIFLALAAEVPSTSDPERLDRNRHRLWSDASPELPYDRIELIGPELDSLLGESFLALGLQAGCQASPSIAALEDADQARYERVCRTLRDDGAYRAMPEGFDFVQRLETYPAVMAVASYGFFEQNRDKLDAAAVGGVEPAAEAIRAGTYPASRTLYLYVKKAHVQVIPGLWAFVDAAFESPPGGLVPPDDAERGEIRDAILDLTRPSP